MASASASSGAPAPTSSVVSSSAPGTMSVVGVSGQPPLACVAIPSFGLQLLLRREGLNPDEPWALVNREEATGEVRAVNRRAWAAGVRPGHRVAAAMSLCSRLRTGVVTPQEMVERTAALQEGMRTFSPRVEANPQHPGVFWLDATGLHRLFGGARNWSVRLALWLQQQGWRATVVVGHTRFGTEAIASRGGGPVLLESPGDEARLLGTVPLERLGLPPAQVELLTDLGLHTVGDLAIVSRTEVTRRFSAEVVDIWRQAGGDDRRPVQNDAVELPVEVTLDLDERRPDTGRLAWQIEHQLPGVMQQLHGRGEWMTGLTVLLRMDDRSTIDASVRLAQPTVEPGLVMDLVRLRLQGLQLHAGVTGMVLRAQGARIQRRQVDLWGVGADGSAVGRRDLDAAARAMARVAAEFGAESVGTWEVHEGHLPEAQARFVPGTRVDEPHASAIRTGMLVRRLHTTPLALPHRSGHEPDGWLVAGLDAGPVVHSTGPYVVSGGWWSREVHREYYFTETRRGDFLWIFYERRRRAWFSHGEVL